MLRLLRTPKVGPAGEPDRALAQGRPDDPLRALAVAASQGDLGAQRTLLVAIGPSLLRIVRGVLGNNHPEVEDTLQEAMVAVHLAFRGFRGECTTLHFACRVAVQTAMNARRKAGYRSRLTPSTAPADLVDLARDDSSHSSPAHWVEAARRREALRQLLCELPAVQAEVLALHTLLGHTVEETAAATQVPVNTVRSRLRNALASLRERVQASPNLCDTREAEP
jgi:RNA polymerase sigma-70 factor (ECF subfamily)